MSYVTSVAPNHPGSDALAEDKKSFWVTTGVFPQEIVVRLSRKTAINTIKLLSVNGAYSCSSSAVSPLLGLGVLWPVTPEKRPHTPVQLMRSL